jgi:hypothetical protein
MVVFGHGHRYAPLPSGPRRGVSAPGRGLAPIPAKPGGRDHARHRRDARHRERHEHGLAAYGCGRPGLQRHLFRVRAIGGRLSLGDRVEDRFEVEDRGVVNRFEAANEEPQAVDSDDLDSVEADRVWPVG